MRTRGRRQRLLVGLVAFVVSAAVTAIAAATATPGGSSKTFARTLSSPSPASASPSAAAQRAPLRIGLSYADTLTWMSDQELAKGLNDAVTLGASWIRVDLSWNDIQPDGPGEFEWHRFDRVVKAADARHLKVLATIGYTPQWAREASCRTDQSCPPADPAAFAAFARDAAQRYGPMGVHTWEIWNEPNLPYWAPAPDPAAYTTLLRASTRAIRSADPQAFLLLGGLAAVATDPATHYVSQTSFLEAVCRLGANKLVDAISYHPYTYPYLPSATTSFGTAFQRISSTKDNLMEILDRYGTPDLPIWITETGAPTDGPRSAADGTHIPAGASHVTESWQASIARDTIPAAAANPHVAAVFWFSDRDSGTPAQRQQRSLFYGLREYDGTAKPAFAALKQSIAAYERTRK
jgi:hypothetical protein